MQRFDRYMLSQLMMLFGFFSLVLVAIYWVNRAVVLFDRLIADGHSAGVFLEFSMLSLPSVIALVLPMAGFAAAIYVVNRMSGDSELTVVQATGYSPWRLTRPILAFGLILMLIMSILAHLLVPLSYAQLRDREQEISTSLSARLLREGAFLHPTSGVTFYIRAITEEGELRDVLLSDRRNPNQVTTYTAERAYLLRDDAGPKLVMVAGLAQVYTADNERLSTTNFEDLTYDISGLIVPSDGDERELDSVPTWEMLMSPAAIAEETGERLTEVWEAVHLRFEAAFLCLIAVLIGHAAMISGRFSRFGATRQIVLGIALLVLVKLVESAVADPVHDNGQLWPLAYLPSVVGLAVALLLIRRAAAPFRPGKAPAEDPA